MNDWNGMPFLIIWGIVAVGVGSMFAFEPAAMESMYRRQINKNRFTRRIAASHAPTKWAIKFYRVSGFLCMLLGLAGFVVGVVGTIGFATGLMKS